jgi:hypothetical protein
MFVFIFYLGPGRRRMAPGSISKVKFQNINFFLFYVTKR